MGEASTAPSSVTRCRRSLLTFADVIPVLAGPAGREHEGETDRDRQKAAPHFGARLRRRERERHLVEVAPAPVLARLCGANDRMATFPLMRGCVLVRRRIAAADLPARHAHPQMHPAASDLQALLTAVDLLR